MAHTITGGVTFDLMAPKMLGTVNIPVTGYSDTTMDSIKSLVQALADQGATARTLTAGGTLAITNYQPAGKDALSTVEGDATEIPINGNVGGFINTYDENGVVIQLKWEVQYIDVPHIG